MSNLKPEANPDERMEIVDAMRGYALLGILLVHCIEMFELFWLAPKMDSVATVVFGIFMAKSFSLLALCFGLSFYIIMSRAERRGVDFSLRFAWRLAILFAFGWLHGLVYMGDILQILAPVGLLLLPLNRIKSNAVLWVIAALLLAQPTLLAQAFAAASGAAWANAPSLSDAFGDLNFYTHANLADVLARNAWQGQLSKWFFFIESGRMVQIVGLFVVGLILGRSSFFSTPEKYATPRRIWLVITLALGVGLQIARPSMMALLPEDGTRTADIVGSLLRSWNDLAYTIAAMLAFVELYQSGLKPLLRLLAPFGRMTLTLYITQSLLLVPVFYGFGLGLYDRLTQAQSLGLGVSVFLVQLLFAHWWLKRFQYGPLEWLWRALTYLSWDVPFRRKAAPAPA